ncbi:putative aldouronate transport system substrate-binding protein [Bacillus niacini]|uniref:Aldouronate transport system substrate-binding protein n=1 Tax=Neobacillus niacini TaxID=86668 RepID=A0A852TCK2_9BACI|nr:sugar ABC transporter substrate-binding protein [Neobacillus niacini]NYE05719.1 putative aldouronate transport system substrate-binding protein [Neobacillus niacini]
MKRFRTLCKRMTILSMASMLSFSLAACVDSSSPQESASTTEDGKTVITMGRVTAANPKLPEGDTYENNAYTRLVDEKLDVKIVNQFEAEGEDYDRQVALAIASGELPDMMRVNSKEELKELVENDLIADLTDVYKERASDNIKEIYDSYGGRSLADATFDDRLMAIPATNGANAPNMVWIRQDWIDKLGLELDKDGDSLITLEELENTAKAFIENDPGASGNPVGIPFAHWLNAGDYGGSALTMSSVAGVFNAHPRHYIEDENGNITYGSTTEGTKKALGVLADLFDKGIIDPQFGTRTWDDIMALLTNGQTGIVTGPWHIPDWGLSAVREMDKNAEFVAYTLEGDNGKANVFRENPTGSFIVVRKDYAHPELAIKILNLFYDELGNATDLETDYPEIAKYNELSVDGSTRPFNIEVYKSTSTLDDFSDLILPAVNGETSIEDITKAGIKNDAKTILEYIENPENAETSAWAKYHSRMKGIGLIEKLTTEDTFNWTTPVYYGTTATMEKKGANLLKLEEEDFIKIVTGTEPLDYFDTFVSKWKKQGGDEILAEIEAELAEQQ